MTEARSPMYHRTTTALVALDRMAGAAGNSLDRAKLGREDLFFLADLPITDDGRHFVEARMAPADRARLNSLVDRCTRPCADFLSAVAPSLTGLSGWQVPTGAITQGAR